MPVEITLKSGHHVLVDDVDADLLNPYLWGGQWFVNSGGYVVRTKPRRERLHRVIMERVIGRKLKRREQVDHINRNKLDCTRDNLRLATHAQNMRNRGPNGNRRYKGVYRSQAQRKRWVAKITVDGEQHYLGTFPTPEKAARAYDHAAKKLHGKFAALNFPGEYHAIH